jgi:hypothetical protein
LVCFAALWRHQLRDGARRMGSGVGSLLARPSLPVKDWGSEPDEKENKLFLAEGLLLGLTVLGVYVFTLLKVIPALAIWVLLLSA